VTTLNQDGELAYEEQCDDCGGTEEELTACPYCGSELCDSCLEEHEEDEGDHEDEDEEEEELE